MSDGVLETFTRQYIEAQDVSEVTFAWQGGEPLLMGLDFFRRAVELQDKYRQPGKRLLNAVQTNGLLLNDEWCHFFRQNDFLVGISIDGPPELHDMCRTDGAGNPSFKQVFAAVKLLNKHGVDFNTLTCVHAGNAEHALDVYRLLRDEARARFIQFIPVVVRRNASGSRGPILATPASVTARQYGDFLTKIFDEWVRRDVGTVFVQTFDVALSAWAGKNPGLCVFKETCGKALVLEHNGDLYSCDHFVEPPHHLGNITETALFQLVTGDRQATFGLAKQDALPDQCQRCDVRFVCNGGRPKNRLLRTAAGAEGLNYLCQGYRDFFHHVGPAMEFMARELRAGRPAAGVMLWTARLPSEQSWPSSGRPYGLCRLIPVCQDLARSD